jgi:CheY-like chemotaxis protein
LAGKRVLIAVDHPTHRGVLHHQITGWQMRDGGAAGSSEEAIALLRAQVAAGDPCHVLLLDLNMPGWDGLTTAREITCDPQLAGLKIVTLASLGQRPGAEILQQAGVSACLLKPVKPAQLRETLLSLLGDRAATAPELPATQLALRPRLPAAARQLRILIAEDNIVNQKVAQAQLGQLGIHAETAADGVEVLRH